MWKDETSGAPAPIWLPLAALLIATAPAQATEIHWNGSAWATMDERPRFDTPQAPILVPLSFGWKYPFQHDRGIFSDDKIGHGIGGYVPALLVIKAAQAFGLDWNPIATGFTTGLIVGIGKEVLDMYAMPKIRHARQTKARAERAAAKGRKPKPVEWIAGEGEPWDVVATTVGGTLAGYSFHTVIDRNENATALAYDQLSYPAPLVGLFN